MFNKAKRYYLTYDMFWEDSGTHADSWKTEIFMGELDSNGEKVQDTNVRLRSVFGKWKWLSLWRAKREGRRILKLKRKVQTRVRFEKTF